MNWNELKSLRQLFLSDYKSKQSYWKSKELLNDYDETFAARIGWKWDSVLKEVAGTLTLPKTYTLIDWGAGTGIATRKFISHFSSSLPNKILLIEKSELAQQFAKEKIQNLHPGILVETKTSLSSSLDNFVLLISHVLTELSDSSLRELVRFASTASAIIWVEPGTSPCSKLLSGARERLLSDFRSLAPCTHNLSCPLLAKERVNDWCHHFAKVPTEAFTTSHWKTFSKEMGIDLRSLPTSYLVLSKSATETTHSKQRLIGRARIHKGYSIAQVCSANGFQEIKILEKTGKKKIKELKDTPFSYFVD